MRIIFLFTSILLLLMPMLFEALAAEVDKDLVVIKRLAQQAQNHAFVDEKELFEELDKLVLASEEQHFYANLVRGFAAFYRQDYISAEKMLARASEYVETIPDEQQIKPLFYQFHESLSDVYVALNDYEFAFKHKRLFLKKYARDLEAKEKVMLESLEEKYQIDQKQQMNELIAQQTKLKQTEIKKFEREKQLQERNVIILVGICLVFVLLIFRQLRIKRQLEWLSQTDTLTHLKNRTTLFSEANKLVDKALIEQTEMTVLVMDVDHFKRINDQFGHQSGDKVLKHVASLGQEVMRSRDIFARLGGEEFVAVLPQATIDEAFAIATRIKDKITQAPISVDNQQIPVTVSIGVAALSQGEVSFDCLIKAADQAMYQAKASGRNCIELYQGSEQS
ncbi:GGDEF domain-containing protein [Thalassotalea euphylliae]|uniref:GGDEF domain-containing protein n=1 Tax=Thalassotalea euphylliae TaxID=1655234 RepID=UPI00364432FC